MAAVPGYDAAIPARVDELFVKGQRTGQEVLRLTGTGYAVLPIEDPTDPVERRRGLEPMMDPLPGARLYRVPGSLPRVYLSGVAEVLPDEAVWSRLFEGEVTTGERVLLAPEPAARPLAGPTGPPGDCRLTVWSLARIAARCRASRPALAVFLEQHDAGWRARVDGQPTPMLRANLVMRAVPVAAGEHTVELSYMPPKVVAGGLMSLFSVMTLLGLVIAARRAGRGPKLSVR
jgi:hypothetical protein